MILYALLLIIIMVLKSGETPDTKLRATLNILFKFNVNGKTRRAFDMKVLNAEHISMIFGGLVAVNDVSIYAEQGELLGLITERSGQNDDFNMLTGCMCPRTAKFPLKTPETIN